MLYELNFYLRLILGPIHPNQMMESDPVNPHHGTWMDQSNFIMQPIDFHHMTQKCHCHMYYGPSRKQSA